jgi:multidrug efflux system membrane fusion protein
MGIGMQSENESKPHSNEHHLDVEKAPDVAPAPPKKALTVVGVALLVLVLGAIVTLVMRSNESKALARETERQAIPYVAVVKPTLEKPDEDFTLPSTLQAFKESPIYARTNGYLVNWTKDIGSRVHRGELLARIDTPEIDQELMQARAARQQVQAQLHFAKTSSERWQTLRKSDAVSQQEADTQSSGYEQAVANSAAADANVRRLEQLESFKNVYAPFDGVIIRRNVDPGALISAGSAGKELFDVAQVDPIRVFVNVPQSYAAQMKVGTQSYVELQEMPGQKFTGAIARTAEAIDPATRTLLVEVDIPNKDGRLLPGAYAQVHIHGAAGQQKMTLPVNAMLFRQEGAQVGVVGDDGIVHLRAISIGRDYGTSLEVLQGVAAGEQVIVNPSDSLQEGEKVNIANNKAPGQNEGQKQ